MKLPTEWHNLSGRQRTICLVASACVFVLVVLLRIRAAMNDLWLDEIWSLKLVRNLRSPLEIFTKIHFANNHYLNSLFIYFFGQWGNWPWYRAPAVIAGSAAVFLAWLIGFRRNFSTAFISLLLIGSSYVMILYSSEARGYGPLVFFCFLCFYFLERYLQQLRWQSAVFFSVSAILGFTAHLQFMTFFIASLIWVGVEAKRSRHRISSFGKTIALCYAAPSIYFIALYLVDLRYLQIGGGTSTSLPNAYVASLAWALGAPASPGFQAMGCTIAVIGLLAALWLFWHREPQLSAFFLAVIAIVPISIVALGQFDLLYVRFFIVGIAFLLLAIGIVLGSIACRGTWGKFGCAVFLCAYLVTNGLHVATLFRYGRGQTGQAIQFMANRSTQQRIITFGGGPERIPFVLQFYWNETSPDRASEYYEQGLWPIDGLDWVIRDKESFEPPVPPSRTLTDSYGNSYDLARVFPAAPLSGLHWFVYQNRARAE